MTAATIGEITEWYDAGYQRGKHWMVVLVDTFDHGDYPLYCDTPEEVHKIVTNPGSMQRVMEIYDLHGNRADQLVPGKRVFNLPPKTASNGNP